MCKRILVIGGTRGTGLLVARIARERGLGVRVMARDPARVADMPELSQAEIVRGDLTEPSTLADVVSGVDGIVFTAGVRSGRHAPESLVKATDHDGVVHTLDAAQKAGFAGRFVYMNTIGVRTPSLTGWALSRLKRNVLTWRRRAETAIRECGLDYAILRVGFLADAPGGARAIRVGQDDLPLSLRYRISRTDVAEALLAALDHPCSSRASFDIVWGPGRRREGWETLFAGLDADV